METSSSVVEATVAVGVGVGVTQGGFSTVSAFLT